MVDWLRDRRSCSSWTTSSRSPRRHRSSPELLRARRRPEGRRHQPGGPARSRASRSCPCRACPRRPTQASCRALTGCNCPVASRSRRPGDAWSVRGGAPVHRAGGRGQAELRRDQRERPGGRRDHVRDCTGMPLAIELAAARIKLLSPDADPGPPRAPARRRWRPARATCPPASRPCAARSPGATTCSTRADSGCSTGCRSSPSGCDLESAEAICGPSAELGGDLLDGLMALADQSLVKVEETARRRAALPAARHDPRVRGRSGSRRAGETAGIRRSPSRLVPGPRRAGRRRAGRRRPASVAGSPGARARRHPGRPRPGGGRARTASTAIRLGFAMWRFWQKHGHLAEARRRLEGMAPADWSHDDPRLRARLVEALGGVCWWQADIEPMARWYRRGRSTSGRRSATRPSWPTPTTTLSFSVRDPDRSADQTRGGARSRRDRTGLPEPGARPVYARSATQGRGQRPLGHRQLPLFPQPPRSGRRRIPRGARNVPREPSDRTMEAWALHMLGTGLLRDGPDRRRPGRRLVHAPPPFPRGRRHGRDHAWRSTTSRRSPSPKATRARCPAARGRPEPGARDRRQARLLRRGGLRARASGRASIAHDVRGRGRAVRRRGRRDDPRRRPSPMRWSGRRRRRGRGGRRGPTSAW